MRLFAFSFKNATVNRWRSITLGFFIFAVSFVMILSNSFILAAKNKVEQVISKGLTGHIQIRSDQSMEGDMVAQYSQGWDALEPLSTKTVGDITQIIEKNFPSVDSTALARKSVFLSKQDKREETMLLGIDPARNSYKDAFLLKEGRYLAPAGNNEILLTEEQANTFKVKVGDTIIITTKNMYGLNSSADLKVVGIGNYIMLSMFSYKACYTDSDVVRKLAGMNEGEATDIILFITGKGEIKTVMKELSQQLTEKGIKNIFTTDERLKSDDLKVKEISFGDKLSESGGVKLSSFDEMGGSFKGISDTISAMLNILVLFLVIIISILIVNLVYMMGIERYREIGTLRAIGFSRPQVIRVFMGEILSITLLSGLLGVLASSCLVILIGMIGISSPIPAFDFIMGKTLSLELDPKSIINIMVIIMGFSFAASFYPAYKACSINPAETIRTV